MISASLDDVSFANFAKDQNLLEFKQAASYYEKRLLGNSNANLIAYGKYYEDDSVVIQDATEGPKLLYSQGPETLKDGEKKSTVSKIITTNIHNGHASYITVLNAKVYFRGDSDYCIYQFDLVSLKTSKLVDNSAGQIIVDPSGIYFISLEDNNCLYQYAFTGMIKKLTNDLVRCFALVGSKIFFLRGDNTLWVYDTGNGNLRELYKNIDSFTYSNGLIVENNGSLIQISGTPARAKVLYMGKARLLGASPSFIAYQEGKSVNILNRATLQISSVSEKTSFAIGVNFSADTLVLYGRDSDGVPQIINISL
jgi:hypothetical protein